MKTPDEIKKGLKCCTPVDEEWNCIGFDGLCSECPYKGERFCGDEMRRDAIAYINQLESQTETSPAKKEALSSHSERDIVLGCISLINKVLNGEFAIFEQLEADGFDFDDYKERYECELGFNLTYFEIVQRLLLECTTHGGGTSTRAKCRELGFDPDKCVEFQRDMEDETDEE